MKCLYKYPQAPFPYEDLVQENRRRTRHDPEYELLDTGVFADNRYFDVFVEYAKAAPDDILIRIEVCNRGPDVERLGDVDDDVLLPVDHGDVRDGDLIVMDKPSHCQ